jgi:hypothetical protein
MASPPFLPNLLPAGVSGSQAGMIESNEEAAQTRAPKHFSKKLNFSVYLRFYQSLEESRVTYLRGLYNHPSNGLEFIKPVIVIFLAGLAAPPKISRSLDY